MKSNIKSFLPLQKLGQGSFASVYKVKRISDDQIYALKKIKMGKLSKKEKDNALNQVRLLASLNSPYITNYYQAFFDQTLDALCIVMEYASKGDLRKMISHHQKRKLMISEQLIWKIMINLLHGLSVLHSNSILHRDLKCQNIFIFDNNSFKIGDMNVSTINKKGFVQTQTGTPYYASPQVWKDMPYDQKSDIWSLGCIIYEMAALNPPFKANNMHQLYKKITKSSFQNIPSCYSNDLSSIIAQCLNKSPEKRPTVSQLLSNSTVKLYENLCNNNIQIVNRKQSLSINLLKTINFPKNIRQLNNILPQSNYKTANKESNRNSAVKLQGNKQTLTKVQPITQNKQLTCIKKQQQKQKIIDKINVNYAKNIQKIIENKNNLQQIQQKNPIVIVKQRRILKQIQTKDNIQPRSRSKSLPRTQNRLRSISSKQNQNNKDIKYNRLKAQTQIINMKRKQKSCENIKYKDILKKNLLEYNNQRYFERQQKNRYSKVLQMAKKCINRCRTKHKLVQI